MQLPEEKSLIAHLRRHVRMTKEIQIEPWLSKKLTYWQDRESLLSSSVSVRYMYMVTIVCFHFSPILMEVPFFFSRFFSFFFILLPSLPLSSSSYSFQF